MKSIIFTGLAVMLFAIHSHASGVEKMPDPSPAEQSDGFRESFCGFIGAFGLLLMLSRRRTAPHRPRSIVK